MPGDAGNMVHQMMFDHGGGRYIRFLKFRPSHGVINASRWVTVLERPLQHTAVIRQRASCNSAFHLS